MQACCLYFELCMGVCNTVCYNNYNQLLTPVELIGHVYHLIFSMFIVQGLMLEKDNYDIHLG